MTRQPAAGPRRGLASCGHPANEDGECDCSSWPERALYACCEHCTHDPGYDPDRHTIRCPDGCNDTVA